MVVPKPYEPIKILITFAWMARFDGIPPLTGNFGSFIIYRMHGQYFMRTSSSLTGERVKTDPAFRHTMQYAALLATASRIASTIYATLPAHRKQHALYRRLTGEVMTWIRYGWTTAAIVDYITKQFSGRTQCLLMPRTTSLRVVRTGNSRIRPTITDIVKTGSNTRLSAALQEWRCQQRTFRRGHNRSITDYTWSAAISPINGGPP